MVSPVAVASELQGLRVLVVEDEPLVALDLTERLSEAGAAVVGPAATVADALGLVARVPRLDAAVLNVQLGDGLVFPVADRLLAQGVAVVFATGFSRRVVPERFAGVPLHEKPVSIDHVARSLKEALAPTGDPRRAP